MLSLGNKLTLTTQPIYKFVNKYSIDFDGVDDRIITDGADTVAQPTTYSFWCKSSETGQNKGVFGHGGLTVGSFHFNYSSNKPLLILNGTSFYRYWDDTSAQDDGEWHHWVVYVDTNDITNSKLYVDGVLQNPSTTVSTGSTNPYTESLTIGSDQAVGGNSFEGKIDEFAVYDRELTQAEITRMYNTYYSPNRVANGNFSQIGNEEVTNGDFSQIGSEEITNGDFATSGTPDTGSFTLGWYSNTDGVEIANGKLTLTNSSSGDERAYATDGVSSNNILTTNKIYKLTFDITDNTNCSVFQIYKDAGSFVGVTNTVGSYTYYITNTSNSLFIFRNTTVNSSISLDNVSIKEVGQDWSLDSATIELGKLTLNSVGGAMTYVSQSGLNLVANTSYLISLNATRISGDTNLAFGTLGTKTVAGSPIISTSGIQSYSFTPTTNLSDFGLKRNFGGSGAVWDITNISVKEVGQHWEAESGVTFEPIDGIATIISNGSFTGIFQDTSINFGNTYRVTIEHKNTTADFRVYAGNQAFDTISTASDFTTSVVDIVAAGTEQKVYILPSQAAQTIQVKSIVVQELKHDATNLMINHSEYQSANPLITSTKSMEFDGSDDYLQLSEPFSYTNHTITGWFKTDDNSSTQEIFSAADDGSDGVRVFFGNTGTVKYRIGDGTSSTLESLTLEANRWYNFACTYDGTTQIIYIDGVNVVSTTPSKTISTTTNVAIGKRSWTTGNYFNGKITEVGAFNRALTSLEVASLYNQGMPTNLLVNRNNYQSGNPTVFNTKQVDFDGTDDHLKVTNAYGSFTGSISAWVKRDSNSSYQFITDFRDNSGTGFFYFDENSDTLISSSGTIYVDGVAASTLPTDGNWHQAVVTGITLDITQSIFIGQRHTSIFLLNGKLSQVGLWNTTLTADEVSSLYNHGLPIDLTTDQAAYESSSNLVGYWRMGSGTLDTYPLIADQTNATLGSELLSQPVDLQTDFINNSGGVIVDADTFTTAGGTLDGIVTSISLTIGKTYKLTVEGNTTSSGFTFGSANGTGREYGSGFGTHYFTALHANIWVRQSTAGTTNITSFSIKQVQGNPAIMTNQTSSDIENGSPYANQVDNGNFAVIGAHSLSHWNTNTNWNLVIGYAESTGATADINQGSWSPKASTQYIVSFEVLEISAGGVRFSLGGTTGTTRTTTGVFTETITTSSTDRIRIQSVSVNSSYFTGKVTNITATEVNTGLQGYWKMGDGTNDEYPVIYDQVDPTLGSELVTNGDFSSGTTDWSAYQGNLSVSSGDLLVTATANSDTRARTNIATEVGKTYLVTAELKSMSGTKVGVANANNSFSYTGNVQELTSTGNYNYYFTAAYTDTSIVFKMFDASTGETFSIDNVSAKEVQGNPATMTNMVEGNITNQFPLTKIRNYYRMGDGILDGYPIIQDQTSPNLAHIPTTNLLPYSEDFSQWTATDCSITSGFTAPDGSNTAYKVSDNGAPNGLLYYSGVSAADQARTIYARTVSGTGTAQLTSHNANTNNIFNLTEDWQRFEVNTTTNVATIFYAIDFRGSGTLSEVLLWGAQTEEQSQATAYIKSDGIAAVRKSSTTNLVEYSEDFSQWQLLSGASVVSNAIISPDGTLNADELVFDGTNNARVEKEIATTNGLAYTFSVYLKNKDIANPSQVYLGFSGTSQGENITITNEWKRYSITFAANGTSEFPRINYDDAGSLYAWGSQFEQQTQAETYAKTTGLPVTIDLFTENNYGTMTNMSASDIIEDTPNN